MASNGYLSIGRRPWRAFLQQDDDHESIRGRLCRLETTKGCGTLAELNRSYRALLLASNTYYDLFQPLDYLLGVTGLAHRRFHPSGARVATTQMQRSSA